MTETPTHNCDNMNIVYHEVINLCTSFPNAFPASNLVYTTLPGIPSRKEGKRRNKNKRRREENKNRRKKEIKIKINFNRN